MPMTLNAAPERRTQSAGRYLDRKYIAELHTAYTNSRKEYGQFRKRRAEFIRQFVGRNYSDHGAADRVPNNLIELGVSILLPRLISNAPRAMVSSRYTAYQHSAYSYELRLNQRIAELDLEHTLREWVTDAFFGLAILKIGVSRTEGLGWDHPQSETFCDVVSLDNFVIDCRATRLRSGGTFVGDIYSLPLDVAQSAEMFDGEAREALQESDPRREQDDLPTEKLSKGDAAYTDDGYKPRVNLVDMWLPDKNLICVFPADQIWKKPLYEEVYDGPKSGPYEYLYFLKPPDNAYPLPPASIWEDLHELANKLYRKMAEQAERAKKITTYNGSNESDAKRIQSASDGDMVQIQPGSVVQDVVYGGVDAATAAFEQQVNQRFMYNGGNLDLVGGMGASSPTLGQDQMLNQNSSVKVQDMQAQVVNATRAVLKKIAEWEFSDPLADYEVAKPLPGIDAHVMARITPDQMGSFDRYSFDVDPFSLQDNSPGVQLQKMQMVLTQFVPTLMPFIQQMGGTLDAKAILTDLGRLNNLPQISEWILFPNSPLSPEEMDTQAPSKPSSTTRNYVRQSVPTRTNAGTSKTAQLGWLGMANQQEQARESA